MNRLLIVPDRGADTPDGPPWITKALCRNFASEQNLWFPDKEFPSATAEAREVCDRCPVSQECLEYALGFHRAPRGVWGGTTTRQRERIRTQRRQAAQHAEDAA